VGLTFEQRQEIRRARSDDRRKRAKSQSAIERAERHVERMSKEHPGLDFSRADAVRSLLTRALDKIGRTPHGGGRGRGGGDRSCWAAR
jgi:hypothetical protein